MNPRRMIALGYLLMAALLITACALGISTARSISKSFDQVFTRTLPVLNALQDMRREVAEELMAAENRQHPDDEKNLVVIDQKSDRDATDAADRTTLDSSFLRYQALVRQHFPDEKGALAEITARLNHFKSGVGQVQHGTKRVAYEQAGQAAMALTDAIDRILQKEMAEFDEQSALIGKSVSNQDLQMLLLSGLTLAISMFGSVFLIRQHRDLEAQVANRTDQLAASLASAKESAIRAEKALALMEATLEGVLPVSHYKSTVSVKSGKDGMSTVVLEGSFKRKDTSATPTQGQGDEDATKTMTSVYRGGLDNLEKISESK